MNRLAIAESLRRHPITLVIHNTAFLLIYLNCEMARANNCEPGFYTHVASLDNSYPEIEAWWKVPGSMVKSLVSEGYPRKNLESSPYFPEGEYRERARAIRLF